MRKRLWLGTALASVLASGVADSQGQQPLDQLVVPLTDVSINKVPYIVAKEAGLFKKYGLDVKLYITPGAAKKGQGDGMDPPPEFVGSATEKRSDLSTGGGVGMTVGRAERGGDSVILATTDHTLRWHVYARPEIKTIEQLKGKRLGVTGESSCTGLVGRIIAHRMKWDPKKDIQLVRRSEERLDALKTNELDAVVINELGFIHAASMGYKPLIDLGQWDEPFLCSGVTAKQSWLKEPGNRDKAIRFLKATVEAIALMHKDDPIAMTSLGKWYGVPDKEVQRRMHMTGRKVRRKPYPNVEGIKLVMRLYDSPNMQKFKPEDFYDDSLMREIDQSGFIDKLYK
jgi:NitT/TauT family transport system substrate-binding protein